MDLARMEELKPELSVRRFRIDFSGRDLLLLHDICQTYLESTPPKDYKDLATWIVSESEGLVK